MSAVSQPGTNAPVLPALPGAALLALAAGDPQRLFAFGNGQQISLGRFLAEVRGVAALLPSGAHVVNLCDDRYRFLVALCAAALRGQVTLLPPSRAPATVLEVCKAHACSYCIGDQPLDPVPPRYWQMPEQLPQRDGLVPVASADALAVIGFTSGSTGVPTANPKSWGGFRACTAQNLAALQHLWPAAESAHVVATVPPQHMYGVEMSVLLPLFGNVAVHAGRPFFPQDVADALRLADRNVLLVSTPVHLRALVESGIAFPQIAGIVSATAPLTPELAQAAERCFGCEVRETFGSTETCIIAHRRTAQETTWSLMPGVRIIPRPDGSEVRGAHLAQPVVLADLVEIPSDGRFELRGRNADLLEIAGKRASLGDLTRKLQAVPGVRDGVILQLDDDGHGVRRIAALAVAPEIDEEQILQALRDSVDPVFLPRILKRVAALPRNETGKLPRAAMLALLHARD